MRTVGRTTILCLVLGLPSAAYSADCTPEQRAEANAELLAIEASPARQLELTRYHLPFGPHQDTSGEGGELHFQGGYIASYDSDLRTSLWVASRLTSADRDGADGADRIECFRRDPRHARDESASSTDYREPVYDQGHMVSDADLKDELIEQLNSYIYTNMSPQHCFFNRGIWLSIEGLVRNWAESDRYGDLIVTSGAIFDRGGEIGRDEDGDALRMVSSNGNARVAVPSHYYKNVLRQEVDGWHSITLLLEHNNEWLGPAWGDNQAYVVGRVVQLSELETLAGSRLHPALARSALTQSVEGSGWDMGDGASNMGARIREDSGCRVDS